MTIKAAERLDRLPPYLFAEINAKKAALLAQGKDIVDLGVGDPDLPTPPHIIEALRLQAEKPENHRYPSYEGMFIFRRAVAEWYQRRFGVGLDPEGEVVALMGAKDGLAHAPWALFNPGDKVLCPDPAYPVYAAQSMFAGAEVGNAFSELNDPLDQRARFEEQARLRERGDAEAQRYDRDFVEALEHGMPPCAGFGVGIDRFFAIVAGAESVREVVFFPTMKPETTTG